MERLHPRHGPSAAGSLRSRRPPLRHLPRPPEVADDDHRRRRPPRRLHRRHRLRRSLLLAGETLQAGADRARLADERATKLAAVLGPNTQPVLRVRCAWARGIKRMS